jgi:hypothetical protein
LFDSSPRHIAAYHDLHRFLTPRHPPCTLHSLTTIMRGCCGNDSPAQRSVSKPYLLPALEIPSYIRTLQHRPSPTPLRKGGSSRCHRVQLDENQWFSNPHYLGSLAHEQNPPKKPDFASVPTNLRPLLQLSKSIFARSKLAFQLWGELSTVSRSNPTSSEQRHFFWTLFDVAAGSV